jgi:hypothetical protein
MTSLYGELNCRIPVDSKSVPDLEVGSSIDLWSVQSQERSERNRFNRFNRKELAPSQRLAVKN